MKKITESDIIAVTANIIDSLILSGFIREDDEDEDEMKSLVKFEMEESLTKLGFTIQD